MLIHPDRKVVIYTPFRCASTTLHVYFDRDHRWWRAMGPQPDDGLVGPHTNMVARDWNDWEFWLPIRDPFERVLSMWAYTNQVDGPSTLAAFIFERLCQPHLGPVTGLYRHTRLLPLNRLGSTLRSLGCDYGDLPRLNRGQRYGSPGMLTERERRQIIDVHLPDIEALRITGERA